MEVADSGSCCERIARTHEESFSVEIELSFCPANGILQVFHRSRRQADNACDVSLEDEDEMDAAAGVGVVVLRDEPVQAAPEDLVVVIALEVLHAERAVVTMQDELHLVALLVIAAVRHLDELIAHPLVDLNHERILILLICLMERRLFDEFPLGLVPLREDNISLDVRFDASEMYFARVRHHLRIDGTSAYNPDIFCLSALQHWFDAVDERDRVIDPIVWLPSKHDVLAPGQGPESQRKRMVRLAAHEDGFAKRFR